MPDSALAAELARHRDQMRRAGDVLAATAETMDTLAIIRRERLPMPTPAELADLAALLRATAKECDRVLRG